MDLQSIFLLLLAALLHSSWNILAKSSGEKPIFFCLALWASSLIYLVPFLLRYQPIPGLGWMIILISALLETVYFYLLGSAYRRGEVSVLYPLARGSAPLLVGLLAACFLGERVSALGFMGILLIVLGIGSGCLQVFGRYKGAAQTTSRQGVVYALLTGALIASYTVVDKKGVSIVDPFIYIYLVFLGAALLLTPLAMARLAAVRREWAENKGSVAFVGVAQVLGYVLVLFAMTRSQVSYVSAVREVSVVIAPLLSAVYLKEKLTRGKIAGSVMVFTGILLVAMAR